VKRLLVLDGVINILLGLLLLSFLEPAIRALGIPYVAQPFYARLLGAVLLGIGLALIIQTRKAGAGLGLAGAIAINLSGGICLGFLLIHGNLNVPVYGETIMWALVVLLVGLSTVELFALKAESADPSDVGSNGAP